MPAQSITTTYGAYASDLATSFASNPLTYVKEAFLRFLQGLFAQAPKGTYHWDSDQKLSEIYLTDESPVNAEQVGTRPAITLARTQVSLQSLGFDDMMSYNGQTGQKQKTVLIPGNAVLGVVSRNSVEVEQIAWVCTEHIWLLRDTLMKFGFFDVGRNITIGAVSPAGKVVAQDGGKGWYIVNVVCPFHLYRTSQFYPLNQTIVKNIEANLLPQFSGVPDNSPVDAYTMRDAEPVRLAQQGQLPKMKDPRNPTREVVILARRPYSPLVRPPSVGSRTLPDPGAFVEESNTQQGTPKRVRF
jgi:hypothetical protein